MTKTDKVRTLAEILYKRDAMKAGAIGILPLQDSAFFKSYLEESERIISILSTDYKPTISYKVDYD